MYTITLKDHPNFLNNNPGISVNHFIICLWKIEILQLKQSGVTFSIKVNTRLWNYNNSFRLHVST